MSHAGDFIPGHVSSLPRQSRPSAQVAANSAEGIQLSDTVGMPPCLVKNESGGSEVNDAHSVRGLKRNTLQLEVEAYDEDRDSKRPRHALLDVLTQEVRAPSDAESTRSPPYQERNAAETGCSSTGMGSSGNATTTTPVSPASNMQTSHSAESIADDHEDLSDGGASDDDDDDMLLVTPAVGSQARFTVHSSSSYALFNVAEEDDGAIIIELPCQEPEVEVSELVAEESIVEVDIEDPVVSLPNDFPRAVKGSQGQKWFRAVMRNVFELLLIEDDFERAAPDLAQIGSLIMFMFQICVTYGQPMDILEDAIETTASFARSRHFTVLSHLRSSTRPFEILKSMSVIALLLASKDLPEDSSTERFMDALLACISLEQEEFLFRRYILAPHQPTETRVQVVPRTAVRLRDLLLVASSSDLSATGVDLDTVRFEMAQATGRVLSNAELELKELVALSDNFWLVGLLVDLWAGGSSPRMEGSALAAAIFACRMVLVGTQASELEVWPDVLATNTGFTYKEAKHMAALYLSQARGRDLEIRLLVQDKKYFTMIVDAVENSMQPVVQWV